MNDETKNISAPDMQPEQAAPESGSKAKDKTDAKGKNATKPRAVQAGKPSGALKSVGLDACMRHGVREVWVTADGQSFAQQCDAKAHAANLNDKQTLKVTAE